jgi:hypothetical protein
MLRRDDEDFTSGDGFSDDGYDVIPSGRSPMSAINAGSSFQHSQILIPRPP